MVRTSKAAAITAAMWAICFGGILLVTPQAAYSITCPPPSCPAPTVTCGVALEGRSGDLNTTSTSSQTCSGDSTQLIVTVTTYIGPHVLCYGPNLAESCSVVPGGQDIDTLNTFVVADAVTIPTLSIWGLGALVTGLGALALRRLGLRSDS